jgi:hypothetical protein
MKITKRPDPSIFDISEPEARKMLVEKINEIIIENIKLTKRVKALESKQKKR